MLHPGSITTVSAQDIHFSQLGASPLHLNPALTGIFRGDQRFAGVYRNQWSGVPVDYNTFYGAYDLNFYNRNLERSRFGAGMMLTYDQAGDSNFSKGHLALSGSYTHQMLPKHFLTIGAQGGLGQRSFDLDDLRWDSQFNGEAVDESLGSRENFTSTNRIFPNLGAGLNWHFRTNSRTNLDLGGALHNINTPEKSFYNDRGLPQDEVELGVRTSLYGIGTFMLTNTFDLFLHASHQRQQEMAELVLGAGTNIFLNHLPDRELALSLGSYFRTRDELDAIIPYLGIRHRMWNFGLSYDINLSQFDRATNGAGGPEISIQYIITKVKPLKKKICPIYL